MKRSYLLIPLILLLTAAGTSACNLLEGQEPTPSGPQLPFQDDFNTPQPYWLEQTDGNAAQGYRDGKFFFRVQATDLFVWDTLGGNFGNFKFAVEARQTSGDLTNSYGVLARYVDADNFYRFDLRGDGQYAVSKLERGEWTLLVEWQESKAIHPSGEVNRIEIACQGPHLTFYTNDQELVAVEDASFERGDAGLFVSTFEAPPTEVTFDNLEILSIE